MSYTVEIVRDPISEIVTKLPELASVEAVHAEAERRFTEGDTAFVADLGIAIAMTYGHGADRVWQYESVFNGLLRLLATTAGAENAARALQLIFAAGTYCPKLDRYPRLDRGSASLLAAFQTADDLAVAFTDGGVSQELRACLVQEMVLKGVPVTEVPAIAEWTDSPSWHGHPLSWLPLTLSPVEQRPAVPSPEARDRGHTTPFATADMSDAATPHDSPVPSALNITTTARSAAMSFAVTQWAEASNGRVEAEVFELAQPLRPHAVASLLMTLGLECLDGLEQENSFSVSACSAGRAWRILFAAASDGGAYGSGSYGAHGRLAAWRSLAGLSGLATDCSYADVEQRVRDCAWYIFEADTTWYEQVAWDIGLAAAAPDRRQLAVLAATDTD
ncbi:DUF6183 family protein [Nocardia beijingensis]|uniref:DUF6183 family protein n=1 Tax=Nocardia beijingensis TaxID=95162 RepID=UPI0033A2722A